MISDLQKYWWINNLTRKALADTKLSNICRCKYLTITFWTEQNMLDGRSIRDMLVTDYSALTHCFFYSTVWLTEEVRKTNVTQRQELPLSDPTTAAASLARLRKAVLSQSHPLCNNSLPYLSISYRLLVLLYILVLILHFTAIVLYTSDPTAANPEAERGAAPKSPQMPRQQSRNWHKGALTSNTHISPSTCEEAGEAQYSTALL